MTAPSPDIDPAELSPEQKQALRELEAMATQLNRQLKRARDAFQFSLKSGEGPLAHAKEQLAHIEDLQDRLGPITNDDERYAAQMLTIMSRLFHATKRIFEIQARYDDRNLALADEALAMVQAAGSNPNAWVHLSESGMLKADFRFPLPLNDPEYMEARCQQSQYLGLQRWMACVDGIDAILRATVGGTAAACRNAEEEAGRAAMADVVKKAMGGNRELAVLLASAGAELSEAWAYFEWGAEALRRAHQLPADQKRQALSDPDWLKLHGKVAFLVGLLDKLQPYPELAQFFPTPELPEVPYEEFEWIDSPTEKLGGTGRLSGGPERAGTGRLTPPGTAKP